MKLCGNYHFLPQLLIGFQCVSVDLEQQETLVLKANTPVSGLKAWFPTVELYN